MKVKVINKSKHDLPQYATSGSAGLDLRADISETIVLEPGQIKLIPTGLHIALPKGYEARIQPRSGLAFKHGITCVNTPGCVDSDYRGPVGVILINLGDAPFQIQDGDRIAQMIISEYAQIEWEAVDTLDETERAENGFGHSGVK